MVQGEESVCFARLADPTVLCSKLALFHSILWGWGTHLCVSKSLDGDAVLFGRVQSCARRSRSQQSGLIQCHDDGARALLAFTGCTRESKYPAGCKAVLTDGHPFCSKCQSLSL